MKAGVLVNLAWLACAAAPALAQVDTAAAPPPAAAPAPYRVAPAVSWGKWAAAAVAVGSTVLGIHQHNAGNNAYRELVLYCSGSVLCSIGSDGRYLDAHAEGTYQRVVRDDRSARAWLIAGQLAALGSAVLFVLELKHEGGPPNIPFNGLLVESGDGVTRVGFRVPVRM